MAATMSVAWPDARQLHSPAPPHEISRLPNGTHIVLRPVHSEDDALMRAFVNGLSRGSLYSRLLGARKPTTEEIGRMTRIDDGRETVLVAVGGTDDWPCMLGDARYVRDTDADSAEFAIVVADDYQGKGLGTLLLRALMRQAHTAGIRRLHGITLASNQPMQELARKLGFKQSADPLDATVRRIEKVLAGYVLPSVAISSAGRRGISAANEESR